jgi:hypothetical protein
LGGEALATIDPIDATPAAIQLMGVFCWSWGVDPHPFVSQSLGFDFLELLAAKFLTTHQCIPKAKVQPPSFSECLGFFKRIENENDFYL